MGALYDIGKFVSEHWVELSAAAGACAAVGYFGLGQPNIDDRLIDLKEKRTETFERAIELEAMQILIEYDQFVDMAKFKSVPYNPERGAVLINSYLHAGYKLSGRFKNAQKEEERTQNNDRRRKIWRHPQP